MKVFLITGRMFSGKDYFARKLANYFMEKNYSVFKTAFAWKLKDYLKKYFGVTKEGLVSDYSKDKYSIDSLIEAIRSDYIDLYSNVPNLDEYMFYNISDVRDKMYYNMIDSKKGSRLILQKFGTEVVRENLSPSYWVDYVNNIIGKNKDHFDVVIVSDRRFINEDIEGSKTIKIETSLKTRSKRSKLSEDDLIKLGKHGSESEIDEIHYDLTVSGEKEPSELTFRFLER
jgi:hypothetical protein